MGGAGHCSGCPQVEIRRMAGNWQVFTPEVSMEVLRTIFYSVLRVIAEIPEAASREYLEAQHWRSVGVRAITHLLLAAAVTHHDLRTTVWGGTAAISNTEFPGKAPNPPIPSPHMDLPSLPPHPALDPQNATIPGTGQASECQGVTSHELCGSFPGKVSGKEPFEIQ